MVGGRARLHCSRASISSVWQQRQGPRRAARHPPPPPPTLPPAACPPLRPSQCKPLAKVSTTNCKPNTVYGAQCLYCEMTANDFAANKCTRCKETYGFDAAGKVRTGRG